MSLSMKSSVKIAFCGMIAALSVALMFLTGIFPMATVALPALAGCLLIPVVAELGKAWGMGVYAVCGVLSFLLAPDREAVLIYLLFFGYYPALFPVLSRLKNRVLRWAAKLAAFNLALAVEALLVFYVLQMPLEEIGFLGGATPVVLVLLANVMFVLYDRVLERVIALYLQRLHGRVRKLLQSK